MPTEVTNYKCPACTGPLHFAGASGKLECEYCGSIYGIEEIEAMFEEKNKEAEAASQKAEADKNEQPISDNSEDWDADDADMKSYSCPSCGAELVCDSTTAATSCPYCGNPTIIPGQFSGMKKPDYVIPFKLDKQAAIEALKNHYKGKLFLPKIFKSNNHIEEVKGVYVPFWLFKGEVSASLDCEGIKKHVHVEGNQEITVSDHYIVERAGKLKLEQVPADASSKMPDDYMDSIEPFNYSEMKVFSKAYMPGYLADKYDVLQEDCLDRITSRVLNSSKEALKKTITGYNTSSNENFDGSFKTDGVEYAMMPVWLLSTKWNNENYLFAMNGQTGKLVGDLPADKKKYWITFAGITAGITLLMTITGIATQIGMSVMSFIA